MLKRFNSLYFGSLSIRHVIYLIFSIIATFFFPKQKIKNKLHNRISKTFSTKNCFTYSSARGALADFLISLNLQKQDEVVISSFTCLAVPTAVIASGAKPVYADIDFHTMNPKLKNIKSVISKKTKVIIVQHTMGVPSEIENIYKFVKEKNIVLIEDCALSIGTKINGRLLGTFSDAAIFSFELSKTVSFGWGGLLIINNNRFVEKLKNRYLTHQKIKLRLRIKMILQIALCGFLYHPRIYSIGKYLNWYLHKYKIFLKSTPDGEYYGKLSENFISTLDYPQTLIANYQWKKIDKIFNVCNMNYKRISSILKNNGIYTFCDNSENVFPVSSRVPFIINERDSFIDWFEKKGIEVGKWFDGPLSPLPKNKIFNFNKNKYNNSLKLSSLIVNFPCNSKISENDLLRFEALIKEYFKKNSNSILVIPTN